MPASCGFAKYLIVAVSDDLCYVFGKADGAFLGKVKNEETLGNDMNIEGMIKIDNNSFVIPGNDYGEIISFCRLL